MTGSNEYKLNQGPEDSISAVKFSPSTAQFLLVSSWDSTVRLYDVVANTIRMKYQHTAPVLDCAFYVSHRFLCVCVFFFLLLLFIVNTEAEYTAINSLLFLLEGPGTFLEWGLRRTVKNPRFEYGPRYGAFLSRGGGASKMLSFTPTRPVIGKQIQWLAHTTPPFAAWNTAQR